MVRRSTPRIDFDGPTRIPYEEAARYLWGDAESGFVADWYYVSNEKLHYMIYAMQEGEGFTHSEAYPTYFGADEVMIVLEGTLALANPETGEVVRAEQGEGVFFREGTWHHGFNVGAGTVRVLEYFSPTPETGAAAEYADDHPNLPESEWQYTPSELSGEFPATRADPTEPKTLYKLDESQIAWRMQGRTHPALHGVFADTVHLHAGVLDLQPGQHTDAESHAGDEGVYLPEGTAFIHCPEQREDHWFELSGGDGCYLPGGVSHEYHNQSDDPIRLYYGVSPNLAE